MYFSLDFVDFVYSVLELLEGIYLPLGTMQVVDKNNGGERLFKVLILFGHLGWGCMIACGGMVYSMCILG